MADIAAADVAENDYWLRRDAMDLAERDVGRARDRREEEEYRSHSLQHAESKYKRRRL